MFFHGQQAGMMMLQIECQPATIEASEAEVETLLSRRFDEVKLLILYIDGWCAATT